MKIRAHHLLLAALALPAVCSVQAQTVTAIFVGKSTEFIQTAAATVIPNPAAPGPNYGLSGDSLPFPSLPNRAERSARFLFSVRVELIGNHPLQ